MQKISTICSCFNSYFKIPILVDSFINQKYINKELIIVDGSNSKEDFNNLKQKFFDKEFLKFFHLPNGTIYECLNLGITESSGSIINIMGDDDFFFDRNLFNEVNN